MSASSLAPAAVALEGIAKKFGGYVALWDISLSVGSGEFICFLGPSGCGKTTLLRIIAGLERQNAGTVLMSGRDVSALPPAQRNYGIVFQSYALFPNLTVGRNVAYGLETRGLNAGAMASRVDELLALVGLARHKDKYPAQLSGGEQQRVALARALALFEALRRHRLTVARAEGLAPFIVASDRTLRDIATLRPRTLAELEMAHGVGPHKAGRYGAGLLRVVAEETARGSRG